MHFVFKYKMFLVVPFDVFSNVVLLAFVKFVLGTYFRIVSLKIEPFCIFDVHDSIFSFGKRTYRAAGFSLTAYTYTIETASVCICPFDIWRINLPILKHNQLFNDRYPLRHQFFILIESITLNDARNGRYAMETTRIRDPLWSNYTYISDKVGPSRNWQLRKLSTITMIILCMNNSGAKGAFSKIPFQDGGRNSYPFRRVVYICYIKYDTRIMLYQ